MVEGHCAGGAQSFEEVCRKERGSLSVNSYEHSGYTAVIDSPESYLFHSLNLIQPVFREQIFHMGQPVYTK